MPNKTAPEVSKFLKSLVCRFGVMNVLQSDQGTEFCNSIVDNLELQLGFNHKISAAYHPQTNGLVERTVQTVKQRIRKCVSEKKEHWDEHLPFILLSVRTSVQSSLKMTLFELLYGVPVRLEATSRKRKHDCSSASEELETSRIKVITEALTATREEAVKNLKRSTRKTKEGVR